MQTLYIYYDPILGAEPTTQCAPSICLFNNQNYTFQQPNTNIIPVKHIPGNNINYPEDNHTQLNQASEETTKKTKKRYKDKTDGFQHPAIRKGYYNRQTEKQKLHKWAQTFDFSDIESTSEYFEIGTLDLAPEYLQWEKEYSKPRIVEDSESISSNFATQYTARHINFKQKNYEKNALQRAQNKKHSKIRRQEQHLKQQVQNPGNIPSRIVYHVAINPHIIEIISSGKERKVTYPFLKLCVHKQVER